MRPVPTPSGPFRTTLFRTEVVLETIVHQAPQTVSCTPVLAQACPRSVLCMIRTQKDCWFCASREKDNVTEIEVGQW
eukprot:3940212-Prorocentrum_lima.AAC.1